MGAHAKLSPSSAKRWMNCPGSVREIAALPPEEQDRSSHYADLGSAAHALGEHCILNQEPAAKYIGHRSSRDGLDVNLPEDCTPEGGWFEVDEGMAEAVQLYLDQVELERQAHPCGELLIEERVFPLPSREDIYGTSDLILIDELEGALVVHDYKHGAGVPVEVKRNEQMMIYALGALRRTDEDAIERVRIVIDQPRAPHIDGPIRAWDTTPRELVEFGSEIEEAAARTEDPDAPLRAGDWCRFCPAAAQCPALNQLIESEVGADFDDETATPELILPDPDDGAQLGKAMVLAELLEPWIREVRRRSATHIEGGGEVAFGDRDWKLVRGRRNRAWLDPEEVKRVLKNKRGVRTEDYLKSDLRSPAQIEKVVGKEWVAKYAFKPEGDLTIVVGTDPRKAITDSMADAFEDLSAESGG